MQEVHCDIVWGILLKPTLLGLEWGRANAYSPLKEEVELNALQQLSSKNLISKLPFSSHSDPFSQRIHLVGRL